MSDLVRKFTELIGAKLISVGYQTSTYVGLDKQGPTLEVNPFCLKFDRGLLVIENPFTVFSSGAVHESFEVKCEPILKTLAGTRVADAEFRKESIHIAFDNESSISISLREKDFSTPEAGHYAPNDGQIIVFG